MRKEKGFDSISRNIKLQKLETAPQSVMKDLHLESLHLIHAGEKTFPLSDNILAVSYQNLLENIKPL